MTVFRIEIDVPTPTAPATPQLDPNLSQDRTRFPRHKMPCPKLDEGHQPVSCRTRHLLERTFPTSFGIGPILGPGYRGPVDVISAGGFPTGTPTIPPHQN